MESTSDAINKHFCKLWLREKWSELRRKILRSDYINITIGLHRNFVNPRYSACDGIHLITQSYTQAISLIVSPTHQSIRTILYKLMRVADNLFLHAWCEIPITRRSKINKKRFPEIFSNISYVILIKFQYT